MATTIDHLRVDHTVRVLREFIDARGIAVRANDTGTIRAMGLDTSCMELWIEWERHATLERLHFALKAPTGPANGRMREYFEMGEPDGDDLVAGRRDVGVRRVADTPPPPTSHDAPMARPAAIAPYPPVGTSLDARAVACDCDVAFHRPVLVQYCGVNACMRCGTVTCTHTVGDEGRYAGNASYAHIVDTVSEALLRWLARWPRVIVRRDFSVQTIRNRGRLWFVPDGLTKRETVYLPADARCETVSELQALEARCAGQMPAFPRTHAPANLPPTMQPFGQFAAAVQLTPESDLSQLMAAAHPGNPACALALAQLARRSDAFAVMVDALRSDNPAWQSAGAAMAYSATTVDGRLPDVLLAILVGLSLAPRHDTPEQVVSRRRAEELLAVIVDQHIATKPMLAQLAVLQRGIAHVDPDLASTVGFVLRELHGIPSVQTRAGFLP